MERLLESFTVLDDEIQLFEIYDLGYYALLCRGPRLDIVRIFNFQPEIRDFDDYPTYLFIQAMQGFFILRQVLREGKAGPWTVCAELLPRKPGTFFADVYENRDLLIQFLEGFESPAPGPPASEDTTPCETP